MSETTSTSLASGGRKPPVDGLRTEETGGAEETERTQETGGLRPPLANQSVVALIPAGGQSSRMGQPKLLMPFGSKTVIEHVIAALNQGGVDRVYVVAARHLPELLAVSRAAGAKAVMLPSETPDMRATVQFGLNWMALDCRPHTPAAWFLVPGDHPTMAASTIAALLTARQLHPDHSIFIPTHEGRRGHPTLVDWKHVDAIRRLKAGEGLNTYFRSQLGATCEVSVATASVLEDVNTPEEMGRASRTASVAG